MGTILDEQLKSWGYNLTNLTSGGMGVVIITNIQMSKIKMRHAKLGNFYFQKNTKKPYHNQLKEISSKLLITISVVISTYYYRKDELYRKYIVENLSLNKCTSYFNCSKKTIFKHITEYNFKRAR